MKCCAAYINLNKVCECIIRRDEKKNRKPVITSKPFKHLKKNLSVYLNPYISEVIFVMKIKHTEKSSVYINRQVCFIVICVMF